jgi:hypothetical protein
VKKSFFLHLGSVLFLFCSIKTTWAGIVFDLEDAKNSWTYKEAVDTANEVLTKETVNRLGAPVQACQVPAKKPEEKKQSEKPKPTETKPAIPFPPPPTIIAGDNKGNVVVDTFQMIEESKFVCNESSKVKLNGADGKVLKSVCPEFLNDLAVYGLGKLSDGKVIQFSKTVKVEKIVNGVKSYFWEKRFALANPKCLHGQTAGGVCLEPYRSVIVSSHLGLKVGDVVYLDDFKDIVIPPGVKHGGYFIVAATKKNDANLKPEINVFLGTDSHEHNSLIQAGNAYKKSGFKLTALKGTERAEAIKYINLKRKEIRALWANTKPNTSAPTTPFAPAPSNPHYFDQNEVKAEIEKLNVDGWNENYSQTILDSIGDQSPLISLNTDEIKEMCPRYPKMNANEKKLFWVHFLRALAKPESGFNPEVGFVESGEDHSEGDGALREASGGFVASTSNGLLQLSYQDALYHGCDFDYANEYKTAIKVVKARLNAGSGKSLSLDQLAALGHLSQDDLLAAKSLSIYDPEKNLECAVKVLENQVGPKNRRKLVDTDLKYYWSVLKPSMNPDGYAEFQEGLKSSDLFCSTEFISPPVAANPPPIPAIPDQGFDEGSFKIALSAEEKARLAKMLSENNHFSVSPSKIDELTQRLNKSVSKLANFHHQSNYDGEKVNDGNLLTDKMTHLLNDLAKDPTGRYAMIDYLEFKGDGLSSNERVFDTKGNKTRTGFGLYQVLASAASEYDGNQNPAQLFSKHAKAVLENRIRISDATPTDKKGLSQNRLEWNERTSSYGKTLPSVAVVSPAAEPKAEPEVVVPTITAPTALSTDQPFLNEGKLVWEGNFPDIDCEAWGLKSENFCFPEPGRIVLSPSHSENSQRNEINHNGVGKYLHEGRMNMSTSLVIKNAIEKCLAKQDGAGNKAPMVKLARWPGETQFGVQEFGSAKAGTIGDNSNSGERKPYINNYLLGDGRKMDKDIAANSLVINIDYNTTCNSNIKGCPEEDDTFYKRDGTDVYVPSTVRTGVSEQKIVESIEVGSSVQDYTYALMKNYLNSLGSNNPVSDMNDYERRSVMKPETKTGVKQLGMFTVGDEDSTRVLTVEFFMNGEIGRRVAAKFNSDDPKNYYEFQMSKTINRDGKTYKGDLIEPTYRMTQEHLLVAQGVALGIMNNKDYQCR